jgi:hypothetical protein
VGLGLKVRQHLWALYFSGPNTLGHEHVSLDCLDPPFYFFKKLNINLKKTILNSFLQAYSNCFRCICMYCLTFSFFLWISYASPAYLVIKYTKSKY